MAWASCSSCAACASYAAVAMIRRPSTLPLSARGRLPIRLGGRHLRRGRDCAVFLLGIIEPRRERLLAHDPDRDRHERMVATAQLGALAVVHTFARCLEPGLVKTAGNRI